MSNVLFYHYFFAFASLTKEKNDTGAAEVRTIYFPHAFQKAIDTSLDKG